MKLTKYLLICCILASSIWTSLEETNGCIASNGRNGQKVAITNCPAMLEIAMSPFITLKEREHLKLHTYPDQTVCCEAPMTSTTTATASATTTKFAPTTTVSSIEPDYADMQESATTDPIMIAANRISKLDDTDSHQYYQILISSVLPKENDCGLQPADERIIGGNATQKDQFRWTVILDSIDGVHCGGSLVNTRYVLTAAHCVYRKQIEDLTLRLGEWDIEQVGDCEDGDCTAVERFEKVNQIIIHPEYRSKSNDIALLRMENALPENYTSHILPICMPFSTELMHDSFASSSVSVVGWGVTETEKGSRYKMYANLTTISNESCRRKISRPVRDNKICATSPDTTNRDACKGDSGGPLQIQINGTYYLIGIVSHGSRCSNRTIPGVYTRVTSFKNWILENISKS